MIATVHGGNLGRWFEQLCRIEHDPLAQIVAKHRGSLKPGVLPHQGGIYAFWWTGKRALLRSEGCNRMIELHGPGGRRVPIEMDDEWLGLDTELPVPLYVGKTANSLAKRIGQHLRLGSRDRMLPLGEDAAKQSRPTTSCQLRAGVEHLFPQEPDTRTVMLHNVGLSYVVLDGDAHAANRFYLEDLAGVGYALKWRDLKFAYRHRYIEQDEDESKLLEDMRFGGPALGVTFRF